MRIQRGTLGLFIAGLGLILLGVAIAYLLLGWRAEQAALQPTDFSAIPASVRYQAPSLSLTDLGGSQRSLSNYRGQVVLVNLWATWCPPCQAEMPLLQAYYERHRAEGFTVVAVEDGEPTADVKTFVTQYGLTFPVWLDPKHIATDQAFKTPNLPTSYVVDRQGEVKLSWYGAISAANLERYVTPLIRER
jgi:cytochrome c biogenesis protein CcmG, thiol:disulfide interchange protein DsbE